MTADFVVKPYLEGDHADGAVTFPHLGRPAPSREDPATQVP